MIKKNFELNTLVRIHSTGGVELEDRTGVILGTAMINVLDFYIVLLRKPTKTHKAIVITEACLEAL